MLLAVLCAGSAVDGLARHRILLTRLGPTESELVIANADGSDARLFPGTQATSLDRHASFSPDGRWIVFTSDRAGSSDIFRVRTDGSGLERLTDDPALDDQAVLSPDGRTVAFVSTRGTGSTDIWVLDLQSRQARNVTRHAGGDFRPSWSPDGRWVAFTSDRNTPVERAKDALGPAGLLGLGEALREAAARAWEQVHRTSIYVMRPNGSEVRRLTDPAMAFGSPKWSPDARRIVAYRMTAVDTLLARSSLTSDAGAVAQIVSIDVVTGTVVDETSGAGLKVSPQFVGDRVAYLVKNGPRSKLAFTGSPGVSGEEAGIIRNPAWSLDGRHVVFQRMRRWTWPQFQPLFSADKTVELAYVDPFPAFSRDGSRLVASERDRANDITTAGLTFVNLNGLGRQPLFHRTGEAAFAAEWSPADEWIVFGLGRFFDGAKYRAQVAVIRPNGTGFRELTKGEGNSGFASWSPDGKRIVYRVKSAAGEGLRIMTVADGTIMTLTSGYDNFPKWCPTADVIAFTRTTKDADIYTIRPDGTGLTRLTNAPGNDAHATWSPDGRHIVFSSARYGFKDEAALFDDVPQPYGNLFVMNADGSNQRALTDSPWEDAMPGWQPRVRD
jgi:TolB protein